MESFLEIIIITIRFWKQKKDIIAFCHYEIIMTFL